MSTEADIALCVAANTSPRKSSTMAPYLSQHGLQSDQQQSQSTNGQDGEWWLKFDVIVGRVIDFLAIIGAFTLTLALMLWITS